MIVAPIKYLQEVVAGDSVEIVLNFKVNVGLFFEIRKAVKLHKRGPPPLDLAKSQHSATAGVSLRARHWVK